MILSNGTNIQSFTVNVSGSATANVALDVTCSAPGLKPGDLVTFYAPASTNIYSVLSHTVTSADEVVVTVLNDATEAIDEDWTCVYFRPENTPTNSAYGI